MSTIVITVHIPGIKPTAADWRPKLRRKGQEPTADRVAEVRAAHSHPNVTWEATTTMSLRR
jgi:hypothetical protein